MRQLAEMIAGKESVLAHLEAQLAEAERMHYAADPFSPAERWYGQQVTILNTSIADVVHELSSLREVAA